MLREGQGRGRDRERGGGTEGEGEGEVVPSFRLSAVGARVEGRVLLLGGERCPRRLRHMEMEMEEAGALYQRAFELQPLRLQFRNALSQFSDNKSPPSFPPHAACALPFRSRTFHASLACSVCGGGETSASRSTAALLWACWRVAEALGARGAGSEEVSGQVPRPAPDA
eukprot:3016179-Rhodomonas_salina.3